MLHFIKTLKIIITGFFNDLYSEYVVYKDLHKMHRAYARESGAISERIKFVIAIVLALVLIIIVYKFL